MQHADAPQAAELSAELGYPVPPEHIENQLIRFASMNNHAVFVACVENQVVAWIDAGIVHHLQSAPYGEIGGLIVASKHQGKGIGKAPVQAVETWTLSQGVKKLLVRSQTKRDDAHAFYLRRGFALVKTSAVFTKPLGQRL